MPRRGLVSKPPTKQRYPPVYTEAGIPIAENIRIMEQAIQERVARDNS